MFAFPWWLSLSIGFLSLSEEILWVRILGFSSEGRPYAFSFVLAIYLLGIAVGAALGKRLCERAGNLYAAAAVCLGASALFDACLPKLIDVTMFAGDENLAIPAVLIVITAALKSALFPIAHQLGSEGSGPRMARSVSRIYFGNILGSAMGPLLTGFVALDFLSIDQCFAISAIACSVLCGLCILNTQRRALVALPLSAVLAGAIFLAPAGNGSDILAHLAHQGSPLTHFVANRYGVVHTTEGLVGDVVYGGNIYDGMTSTDVDRNSNRLDRVYMLALLHPRPRRALVIGMSTGAWTRVLEAFPDLESMDIVEINPAYVSVSSDYSNLTPLLRDPRLKLHIDDGRRWLKRNPGLRFDLIVQNTTFHWRANLTNLLSREYFTDVRRHLNPGGILTVNTTGSFDVLATGAAVFSHAYRYANFMYASDTPLTPVLARLERVMRPDGRPFTFQSPPAASVAALLRQARLEPVESFMAQQRASGEVITDDNLLPEFRHGRVYGPESLYPFYRQPALFNMDAP